MIKATSRKHLSTPICISVIMPCFNAEKYLREAIESVLDQTYPHVELLVVDDGSIDGSKDILRGYGERIVLIEQKNRGPYPARNVGIKASKGEFIAFLDADDYWHKDCLKELYAAINKSKAALAYCGWQNIGVTGKRGHPYIPPDYELGNRSELFLHAASPWPIHAALIRRNVLEEVGGFDERWPTCMDYDLWLRAAVSRPIERVEKVLAFYRHHDKGQITSTQWRQARNVWLIKKQFVKHFPELVADIPPSKLRRFIDGALLHRGYEAYWRRDLVSAQKIFRMALRNNYWELKDLRYLLPAILPPSWYVCIIQQTDHKRKNAG